MKLTIDNREFNRTLARMVDEYKTDARTELNRQGRLFTRDAIAITPPMGRAAFTEAKNIQRTLGEAAVERDVRKVFQPLSEAKFITNPTSEWTMAVAQAAGISGVEVNQRTRTVRTVKADAKGKASIVQGKQSFRRTLRRKRGSDLKLLRLLLERAKIDKPVLEDVDPAMHQAARNKRGRVRKPFRSAWILNEPSITQYVRKIVKHVGKAKGGWRAAAQLLNNSASDFPRWAERHVSTPSLARKDPHPLKPSLTLGNLVRWSSDFSEIRIVEKALSRRTQAMRQHMEHRLAGKLRRLSRAA